MSKKRKSRQHCVTILIMIKKKTNMPTKKNEMTHISKNYRQENDQRTYKYRVTSNGSLTYNTRT